MLVHYNMLVMVLLEKYALERWKESLTFMIPKDTDNAWLHRLRVIHILEADYNLLLKIFFRWLVWHAEDNNLLAEDQHGS